MKFLTLVAVGLIGLTANAQNASMAYNPDSNGDDLIGAPDLISLLGLYSTLMIDTANTCNYEGTELEQLITGLLSEDLILDSVYVEYLLIDSQLTYLPGCPEPVYEEVLLDRSYKYTSPNVFYSGDYVTLMDGLLYLGFYREIRIRFNFGTGQYEFMIEDQEISALSTTYAQQSNWNSAWPDCCNYRPNLPFPESWTLNEDGVQVTWRPADWANNCEHLRVIPYWHEAE